MNVEAVEGWRIDLPLIRPHASADATVARRDIALIRLKAQGIEGWGECSPVPGYSLETMAESWAELRDVAPLLVGHAADPGLIADHAIPSSPASALEGATWDVLARRAGKPLWRFLGSKNPRVRTGAVIGLNAGTPAVAAALSDGYRQVKVKIAPGAPEECLREIVARFPELPIGADANGSYGAGADPSALDALGLLYLEQPLPRGRLNDHAELVASMSTPICLDEDVTSVHDVHRALEVGAADAFTVRAQRIGGAAVMGVQALAVVDGFPLRYGGMLESGVGRAHAIALATLPGFTLPADLGASNRYFRRDVTSPAWILADGQLVAPNGPGIGVEVDRELVNNLATDHFSFS